MWAVLSSKLRNKRSDQAYVPLRMDVMNGTLVKCTGLYVGSSGVWQVRSNKVKRIRGLVLRTIQTHGGVVGDKP